MAQHLTSTFRANATTACLRRALPRLAVTAEFHAAIDPQAAVFDRVFTKPPELGELLRAVG